MLLLQCALHQIHCGTARTPERMIDLLEVGCMHPPLDLCVDARAVYDAIRASDACEPAESSLKLHLISVWDRMTHGLIRKFWWVDTRDMLADGLTMGGIDRLLLHNVSNDCNVEAKHISPFSRQGWLRYQHFGQEPGGRGHVGTGLRTRRGSRRSPIASASSSPISSSLQRSLA